MALNWTSSESWLNNYRGQTGITYPMIFDGSGQIRQMYQVGSPYGNIPPTYVIIDPKGIVRYRVDDSFNRTTEIIAAVRTVLSNP